MYYSIFFLTYPYRIDDWHNVAEISIERQQLPCRPSVALLIYKVAISENTENENFGAILLTVAYKEFSF